MANLVFRNAFFTVNNVDLSDHVVEATLNLSSEMLDATKMGDDTRVRKGGLKTWSMDVTFQNDFAAAKVDATLWPLLGTSTCVELRPVNTCSTGINPNYWGIASVENYPPMSGAVGSLLTTKVTFQSAGTLARQGVSSS